MLQWLEHEQAGFCKFCNLRLYNNYHSDPFFDFAIGDSRALPGLWFLTPGLPFCLALSLLIGEMIASCTCDELPATVLPIMRRLLAAESDWSLRQPGVLILLGIIALKDPTRGHALIDHVPHFVPALCRGLHDRRWSDSFRATSCWAASQCLDVALQRGEMDAQSYAQTLTCATPLPRDLAGVVAEYLQGGDLYFWPLLQSLLRACEHCESTVRKAALAGVVKACAGEPKLVGLYLTPIVETLSQLLQRYSERDLRYQDWSDAMAHLCDVMREYPAFVSPRTSEVLWAVARTWCEKLTSEPDHNFHLSDNVQGLQALVPFILPHHCEHLFQLCVSYLTNWRDEQREIDCQRLLVMLGATLRQLGSRSSCLAESSSVGPLLLRYVTHEAHDIVQCAVDAVADAAAACPSLIEPYVFQLVNAQLFWEDLETRARLRDLLGNLPQFYTAAESDDE